MRKDIPFIQNLQHCQIHKHYLGESKPAIGEINVALPSKSGIVIPNQNIANVAAVPVCRQCYWVIVVMATITGQQVPSLADMKKSPSAATAND